MKYTRITTDKNEIYCEQAFTSAQVRQGGKYAIELVFSGSADYTVANREITLFPGRFIVLNPNTCYSRRIDAMVQVNSMSIQLDPGFVRDFDYSIRRSSPVLLDAPEGGADPHFMEAIYALEGDMKVNLYDLKAHVDNGIKDPVLLNEYLHQCLANYYGIYQSEITGRAAALKSLNRSTKSEILRRLSIARDYIISNYNKDISLEDIASMACLSVNHFLRTFKQAYQQSPHQFLTSVRLQQAKYYLKNTDYPVNEIVDIVGFECPSSFIRLFRNAFNVTPGQYR